MAESRALATLKDRYAYVANDLERHRARLQQIIPIASGLGPSRAIAVVLDSLVRTPTLLDCEPRSIVRSVLHAAELGLELGSHHGEAFLVPFKGKATMMVGYKGFVRLIRGSPRVTIVKGVIVREADTFEVDEGANVLVHKLGQGDIRNRGQVTHAYSRVYYTDSSSQFEVMDRVELDMIKSSSKDTRNDSPWRKHTEEMYKKCPLRRQAKWLDLSQLGRKAVELDDLEAMRRGELGAIRDREGFDAKRLEELKEMLAARDAKVDVIDAEVEELGS